MADDLELAMRSIEGEAPSPDFVAALRERVLAEAEAPAVVTDDEAIVDVRPRPLDQKERSMTKTRWMMVGAAAAVIALVVGLVAVTGGDDDTIRTDDPTTQVPATTAPTTVPPTTVAENAAPFGADIEELPTGFTGLDATAYWTDTLGTPFSIELGQSLFLQENRATSIALSSPASRDPGDKDMVFLPLSSLWSPNRVGADDATGAGLVAHLASLEGRVVLSNVMDVTVGGLDAIRFDIEVDTSSCGPDTQPCEDLAIGDSGLGQTIEPGWSQRIWIIDVGETPIAVKASIWFDNDAVWLDVIEGYVETMTFAEEP